jgi:hypothetical protein
MEGKTTGGLSMRRLFGLVLAGLCAFALAGEVRANQNNTGCGLGSILFKGQEGLVSQTLAGTTNGIYGNQTFGITTGTSNCQKATTFTSNERLDKFVRENMDNLAVDISKGSGEYLTTLAVLLDTPIEQRANLYRTLQLNFSQIYTSANVTHVDVLNHIETVLRQPS